MNWSVGILNVGAGDTKLSFDKSNPQERERAAKIVADMLKRGYALLVQVGEKDGEPIYQRAKAFDPETCEYIVPGGPDDAVDIGAPAVEVGNGVSKKTSKAAGARSVKTGKTRRIDAGSTHAVGVARTAGG